MRDKQRDSIVVGTLTYIPTLTYHCKNISLAGAKPHLFEHKLPEPVSRHGDHDGVGHEKIHVEQYHRVLVWLK